VAKNLAGTTLPAGNGGVTYPSPNEWPITVHSVTGITKALQPIVTAPGHGITTTPLQSTPSVDFTQVKGMTQINGQFAFVVKVIDVDNFTIALDTTNYSSYLSGGFVNVIVSPAPINPLTNTFP
jgi:hypothetical protein